MGPIRLLSFEDAKRLLFTRRHLFYLDDEIQCRLMGGEYVLAMDEFFYTGIKESLTGKDGMELQ